jgi:hypothetical protein
MRLKSRAASDPSKRRATHDRAHRSPRSVVAKVEKTPRLVGGRDVVR